MSPLCMRMKLYKQLKQATTKPLQSRSSPHGRLAPLQTPDRHPCARKQVRIVRFARREHGWGGASDAAKEQQLVKGSRKFQKY